MSTRIENILARARITLADPQAQRWSDDMLLTILSEGYKDLCLHSQTLHSTVLLDIQPGEPFITLPEDLWLLTRIEWNNARLEPTTHTELDNFPVRDNHDFFPNTSTDWQLDTGQPEAYIYDRRNLNQIRLYPTPDDTIYDTTYTFSSDFGLLTDIPGYSFNPDFGVSTDFDDPSSPGQTINSNFGVVTGFDDLISQLKVQYISVPGDLNTVDDELLTPVYFELRY